MGTYSRAEVGEEGNNFHSFSPLLEQVQLIMNLYLDGHQVTSVVLFCYSMMQCE